MKEMKVELTFMEEVLGTSPANGEIYDRFIASLAPDSELRREETETIISTLNEDGEEVEHKAITIFPRTEDNVPFTYDYQIKGFFKDTCSALKKVDGTASSKCKAFKKEIDGLIFIKERQIPFVLSGETGICQRPLRAATMQGERIALASSETIPAGSTLTFTIQCLIDADMKMVIEWLDYGTFRGLGQWRNSGKGRFTWRDITE